MKTYAQIGIGAGVGILVFLLMQAPYFAKQVGYYFTPDTEMYPEQLVEPNTLSIPSLHITAPLIYVSETSESVFQEALASGVVHYPGTAMPGQLGNAYYFGHSSDFAWAKGDYKTVFALLPQIEQDAEIYISDPSGTLFRYRVVETMVVEPNDFSVIDQFEKEHAYLSLQTSYPIGTALQRFVVRAELVEGPLSTEAPESSPEAEQ